jgi:Zn-dependent peptidase ImmA (M78 family)
MDRAAALRIAEETFPNGPERIAEILGAEIVYASINVDGWCLSPPSGSPLITLNKDSPRTRQRFTLAHELAHLILGTKPDLVGRRDRDLYHPKSPEEKAANQLASELLLPLSCLRPLLTPPIDSRVVAAVARQAGVSEVALVLRLVRNADEFGLLHPTVARIEDGTVAWKVPFNRPLTDRTAATLYANAVRVGGTTRTRSSKDEPVLVCALSNSTYPILFYYWLPPEYAAQETAAERRQRIEGELFGDDSRFRHVVNGYLGAFKHRAAGQDLVNAVAEFHERYGRYLVEASSEKYGSTAFEEYLRFRLAEWVAQE